MTLLLSALFVCFLTLSAWENELTTSVIQRYYPPNDILKAIKNMNFDPEDSAYVTFNKDSNFHIKKNVSRIIGHVWANGALNTLRYNDFKTPDKFIIPVFTKGQEVDLKKSMVVAMHVYGQYAMFFNKRRAERLINFAGESGVCDFFYKNILIDTHNILWLIDLEIFNVESCRTSAAQCLLDNRNLCGYSLTNKAVLYLEDICMHDHDYQADTQEE